jgi:hypothetical protein
VKVLKRFDRVRRVIKNSPKYLWNKSRSLFEYYLPKHVKWGRTQVRYDEWSQKPLCEEYLDFIVKRGKQFSEFVGDYNRLIDVGCGNGLIGGKPYAEVGYCPIKLGGFVLGVDPLPIIVQPPWVTEYLEARIEECENIVKEGKFDKATIITSLGHFENPLESLKILVTVHELCLWETVYRKKTLPDLYHMYRFTLKEVLSLLLKAGWTVTEKKRVDENYTAEGWFIRAKA